MTIKVGDRVRRLSRWATSSLPANEYEVDEVRFLGYTQEIHLKGQPPHQWWHGDRFATLTSMSTGPIPRMEDHKAAHRANDPDTSVAAAKVKRTSLRERVSIVINGGHYEPRAQGWTGHELAASLDAPLNSVTPRLAELRRTDRIKDSGQRRDGQIVWVVA